MTRILWVRHGETAWNTERRLQGQLDIPLNWMGQQQAECAGRALAPLAESFAALYASDLSRAFETACRIGKHIGRLPQRLPEVRERRYGIFEGLTYTEAEQQHPDDYAKIRQRDPEFPLPGNGESLLQFHYRIAAALEQLRCTHPNQSIIVVAHGGVLDILNRHVTAKPLQSPRDFDIPNAGFNRIAWSGKEWILESWAETHHLAELHERALDEVAR